MHSVSKAARLKTAWRLAVARVGAFHERQYRPRDGRDADRAYRRVACWQAWRDTLAHRYSLAMLDESGKDGRISPRFEAARELESARRGYRFSGRF